MEVCRGTVFCLGKLVLRSFLHRGLLVSEQPWDSAQGSLSVSLLGSPELGTGRVSGEEAD